MKSYDIKEILKKIPHRYPFLLIDAILEIEEGKSCKALKNVSFNEHFFQGHFPHQPIMPGVLILEAMAQTATVMQDISVKDENVIYMLVGISKASFKIPVVPGDQLILTASFLKAKLNMSIISAKAFVKKPSDTQEKLAATAEIKTIPASNF